MQPTNGEPTNPLTQKVSRYVRRKAIPPLERIYQLQVRIVQAAQTAKGKELAALCHAYEGLEEHRRILRRIPHPDLLVARSRKVPPGAPGKVGKGHHFPEPRETEVADPGSNPGTGPEPGDDSKESLFGTDG